MAQNFRLSSLLTNNYAEHHYGKIGIKQKQLGSWFFETKYLTLYLKWEQMLVFNALISQAFLGNSASWFLHNRDVILAITLKINLYKADLELKGSWQQFTFQIIFCWLRLASRNDTTHWRITYIYAINKLFLG